MSNTNGKLAPVSHITSDSVYITVQIFVPKTRIEDVYSTRTAIIEALTVDGRKPRCYTPSIEETSVSISVEANRGDSIEETIKVLTELLSPKYTGTCQIAAKRERFEGVHVGTTLTLNTSTALPENAKELVESVEGVDRVQVGHHYNSTLTLSLTDPANDDDNANTVAALVAKKLGLRLDSDPITVSDPQPQFALLSKFDYRKLGSATLKNSLG